jgi:6-phospho-3-hexuloisomerase
MHNAHEEQSAFSLQEDIPHHQSVPKLMRIFTSCMEYVITMIDPAQTERLIQEILNAERIYLSGVGRSDYVAKAFAMCLTHLKLDAFVVGETVTPAFKSTDLLITFSESGKTLSTVESCQKAKKIGGKICLITSHEKSPLATLADCTVVLNTNTTEHAEGDFEIHQLTGKHRSMAAPVAPLATLFETAALILSYATIAAIMEIKHRNIMDVEQKLVPKLMRTFTGCMKYVVNIR